MLIIIFPQDAEEVRARYKTSGTHGRGEKRAPMRTAGANGTLHRAHRTMSLYA